MRNISLIAIKPRISKDYFETSWKQSVPIFHRKLQCFPPRRELNEWTKPKILLALSRVNTLSPMWIETKVEQQSFKRDSRNVHLKEWDETNRYRFQIYPRNYPRFLGTIATDKRRYSMAVLHVRQTLTAPSIIRLYELMTLEKSSIGPSWSRDASHTV